ncbi:MAG: ABC transporter permease [Gammaproteobacteria bacterium]
MTEPASAFALAVHLLFSGDPGLWQIIGVSLFVAFAALLAAAPPALAAAYFLANRAFFGRRVVLAVLQSLLSFPTVAIGLILYLLLSRRGILGAFDLLFTPAAMAIGQALIVFPVLTVFALAALQKNDNRIGETAQTLGASKLRAALTEMAEARFGIIAALLTGFGRAISEVGCALMVGGNIAHYTRNITTAIALETGAGKFAEGIALGMVLVFLALAASALLSWVQGNR